MDSCAMRIRIINMQILSSSLNSTPLIDLDQFFIVYGIKITSEVLGDRIIMR